MGGLTLTLLKEILPQDNTQPENNYEAKKLLCPMGMDYEKIHVCPNDCILYRNEYAKCNICPRCGKSRYKPKVWDVDNDVPRSKGTPAKVLWYLPIIPRFKRLFANPKDIKRLTWHDDERVCDDKLRHPADSPRWKKK